MAENFLDHVSSDSLSLPWIYGICHWASKITRSQRTNTRILHFCNLRTSDDLVIQNCVCLGKRWFGSHRLWSRRFVLATCFNLIWKKYCHFGAVEEKGTIFSWNTLLNFLNLKAWKVLKQYLLEKKWLRNCWSCSGKRSCIPCYLDYLEKQFVRCNTVGITRKAACFRDQMAYLK